MVDLLHKASNARVEVGGNVLELPNPQRQMLQRRNNRMHIHVGQATLTLRKGTATFVATTPSTESTDLGAS